MTDANHRAKPITRRTKALTLIPGVAASCAATALVLTTTGVTPTVLTVANKPLISDTTVPVQVIQPQATLGQVGQVAPAIPNNAIESVVATTTTSGIPAVALNAYQHAAQVLNASDPRCHLPWALVGAIGRVESDHGQFGGSHLNAQGEATPPIYGPNLDGTNGMALIRDTDGGALDGNSTYDRAVGPMQFLPSTWAVVGVDGNGDSKRDPQNIYDASLAAGVYLCSGRANMNNPADLSSSIYRYNHNDAYVALVTAIMNAYKSGNYTAYPVRTYAAAGAPTQAPPAPGTPTTAPPSSPAGTPTSSSSSSSSKPSASGSGSPSPSGSSSPTASPSTPMSAAAARSYCQSHADALTFLVYSNQCTSKLTGMTPAQADSGWAAHKSNLPAWFTSPN